MDSIPTADGGELAFDDDANGYAARIVRRDADGREVWTAVPSFEPSDAWTFVDVDGATVVASSWSGYRVVFDLGIGTQIAQTFPK